MTSDNLIQIIGLIIVSSIFITILRISFQLGKYTNRLEIVERILGQYIKKVDDIDKNVTVLLDRSNLLQQISPIEIKKA